MLVGNAWYMEFVFHYTRCSFQPNWAAVGSRTNLRPERLGQEGNGVQH